MKLGTWFQFEFRILSISGSRTRFKNQTHFWFNFTNQKQNQLAVLICQTKCLTLVQTSVGWLLEIGRNSCWLSGWFLGFIPIILKKKQRLIMVYNHSFEEIWKQSNIHLEHCQFFTNSFMKQYIIYDFLNNQHWWFFYSDSFREMKLQFSDFETFANSELAILWKLK